MRPLTRNVTPDSAIEPIPGGWRFSIPTGTGKKYNLAQLDDYTGLARKKMPYNEPVEISLRARVSGNSLPGTWGFGLWNDPFGVGLGFGGKALRLPCLPNAIWFFHAAPPNHLSLNDDQPGEGLLAMSFRSPHWPTLALSPLVVTAPLLAMRRTSRWLRQQANRIIKMESRAVLSDQMKWHTYRLLWRKDGVRLSVDELTVLETPLSPIGPLGLVLWIDNQYAAWRPDGSLDGGLVAHEASWLEIVDLEIQ